MKSSLQSFHLFVESFSAFAMPAEESSNHAQVASHGNDSATFPYSVVEVPGEGLSYLSVDSDGGPQVTANKPARRSPAMILEPIRYEHRPYLSALIDPGSTVRVNGFRPPPVAILRQRDVIEIDTEHALHVTLFTRPYVGRPPDDAIGKECPVCLTPISATSTVYVCPFCQRVLHAGNSLKGSTGATNQEPGTPQDSGQEQESRPAAESETAAATEQEASDDELECVRLSSTCPGCEHPIVLSEGYAYVPDF